MNEINEQDQVLFWQQGAIGSIRLNRPKALNALTHEMIFDIQKALINWAKDSSIEAVIIDGAGEKAFCAGGDIVKLYNNSPADAKQGQQYWYDEYQLNALIANYAKPYIAIMNGITMGGGVGISAHGSHRLVTEETMLAMPEVGIGFLPDVGGTYLLARSPGKVGLYLGISGARMDAADAIYAGFADSYISSDRLEDFTNEMINGASSKAAIEKFSSKPDEGTLKNLQDKIDLAFGKNSVLEIVSELEKMSENGDEWAMKTLNAIRRSCPLSVAAAFAAINNARNLSLIECLQAEYRFAHKALLGTEFYEGVRAAVIDKDRSPKWQPATLEQVTPEMVHDILAPIGENEWQQEI